MNIIQKQKKLHFKYTKLLSTPRSDSYNGVPGGGPAALQELAGHTGGPGPGLALGGYSLQPQPGQMQQISLDQVGCTVGYGSNC